MEDNSKMTDEERELLVSKIMEVVEDCVDMQDGDGSSCVVAVLDFDKLHTRLKTLFP